MFEGTFLESSARLALLDDTNRIRYTAGWFGTRQGIGRVDGPPVPALGETNLTSAYMAAAVRAAKTNRWRNVIDDVKAAWNDDPYHDMMVCTLSKSSFVATRYADAPDRLRVAPVVYRCRGA